MLPIFLEFFRQDTDISALPFLLQMKETDRPNLLSGNIMLGNLDSRAGHVYPNVQIGSNAHVQLSDSIRPVSKLKDSSEETSRSRSSIATNIEVMNTRKADGGRLLSKLLPRLTYSFTPMWAPYLCVLCLLFLLPVFCYGARGRINNHNYGNGQLFHAVTGNIAFYAGGGGDTSFNFVQPSTAQANFNGVYAHSSLQPVANYVSRPDLERQMHDRFHASVDADTCDKTRKVVVWGLGGSGKTQLALDYVQKHRREYHALFWVEAGQKQTIERDFIQIYKTFFPSAATGSPEIAVEDAIDTVKRWFYGQERRSLWVMDSADTIEDEDAPDYMNLNRYLPDAPCMDIIITTRSSRVMSISSPEAVAVTNMTGDEAVQLFRNYANLQHTNKEVEQDIMAIVEELGYLPLAVTLAGSYVKETPRLSTDLREYLPEYRAHRKRLLNRKARQNVHRYTESVLSTWEMSFMAVQRQRPVAARLLTLLAFMNFDDIFLRLFEVGFSSTPSSESNSHQYGRWIELLSSSTTIVDRYVIEDGFAMLQAYSLVSWRGEQEAYVMHKLVHAWSHDRLEVAQQQEWSLMVSDLLSHVVRSNLGDLDLAIRIVPHVVANFNAMSSACGPGYETTDQDRNSMKILADLLKRLGRWDYEKEMRAFLYHTTASLLGREHPDTLMSMNNLAVVLSEQGKHEQAVKMHRQALDVMERVLGREHPNTLTSMGNLAIVLSRQGKREQAVEIHRQVLDASERVLGREHLDTLKRMNNLAEVLSRQGKNEQAGEMHRQALDVMERVLGWEHPDTLTSMNDLALVLSRQGKHEQAVEMHRQVLDIREKALGQEHPDTLTSMNNLAVVLSEQGKHEQAVKMHRQALDVMEGVLGREHPNTLMSMNNLAGVLFRQGKHKQAEEMHRQALDIMERVLGREHLDTLTSMNNLAEVLSRQGKNEQAGEMHRQALDVMERILGREHPGTLTSMNNLALVLSQQGKHEQAVEIHRQVLDARERVLGREHPDTLMSMNNLAGVLNRQGKHKQAEEMHRQALDIMERVLGREHPNTLMSMNNLAVALSRQGKHEEARRYVDKLQDSWPPRRQQEAARH